MLTKLKTLLLGCSLACIGFSCSNHPVLTNADDVEQPLDSGYITLDLRSNLHLSRKGGTHDPLRSVRRVTFLFFHETDSKLLLSRTVEPTSDLSFDLKIPKQNYRLAVLVNSGTSYAAIIPEILLPTTAIQATSQTLLESFAAYETGNITSESEHSVTMANDQGLIKLLSTQIVDKKSQLSEASRLSVNVEPCLARVLVVGKPTISGGEYTGDVSCYVIDVVPQRIYPLRHLAKLSSGTNEAYGDNSPLADRYASSWAEESIAAGVAYNNVYGYVKADMFDNPVAAAKMQEKKTDFNLNQAAIYTKESTVNPKNYFTAYVPRVVLRAKYVPHGIPGVKPDEGWIEFQGRKMSLEQFKKYVDNPVSAGMALADSIKKAKADNSLVYTGGFVSYGIQFYYKSQNYYAIPIRHFDDEKAPNKDSYGRFGLVRNNEYVLSVKSITGAGSPIVPPVSTTEAIEKEGYLPASIAVNQTTAHEQDVDL